jgi:hypothetical protein
MRLVNKQEQIEGWRKEQLQQAREVKNEHESLDREKENFGNIEKVGL